MQEWWTEYPWRYIQTNLRQIDMADIDAKRYVEELRAFGATIAMINTSGILASYPTDLEFHTQSPYLTGDSLITIIEECHKAGIKVIARTDFSKIRREIYERHPEWAYISPQGKIVDYNGDVHACVNGGFQREYKLKILQETLEKLPVDGLFFNMGGFPVTDYSHNYYGICHCESCKSAFREMFGLELPQKEDMADPVYRKYRLFKKKVNEEETVRISRFVRALRPDLLINMDTTQQTGYIRWESNTALDRPLPHWQYTASENAKWLGCSYPGFRVSNCDVDFIDFPVRHVTVSPAQQELRLAQTLANGAELDYYLIGRLDNHEDKSAYGRIKEMFALHKAHEDLFLHRESIAPIVLVRPEDDAQEYRGWYRALTEGHFLFDVILAERLEKLDLSKYRALVLPDVKYLSDAAARAVDAFVENGGTLLSCGQSGFYDDSYEERDTPAVRAMGVERCLLVKEDSRGTLFKIRPEEYKDLPRFTREEQLIFLDGAYLFHEYAPGFENRLAYIPPHPFGPPERCYYTQITDLPGYVHGAYGKGTSVYAPWYPGKLLYRQGYMNTWNFLVSLLEAACGDCRVGGNLSPMAEVTLQRDPGDTLRLFSVVNASGHYGVSFFDPVPIKDVSCTLPIDRPPATVTRLSDGEPLAFDYDEKVGRLTVTLSQSGLYDAAVIRF